MSDRREEAVGAALALLEEEGEAALTMRRVADRVGVRAPSLHKHLRDRAALEAAVVERGLGDFADAVAAAPASLEGSGTRTATGRSRTRTSTGS